MKPSIISPRLIIIRILAVVCIEAFITLIGLGVDITGVVAITKIQIAGEKPEVFRPIFRKVKTQSIGSVTSLADKRRSLKFSTSGGKISASTIF